MLQFWDSAKIHCYSIAGITLCRNTLLFDCRDLHLQIYSIFDCRERTCRIEPYSNAEIQTCRFTQYSATEKGPAKMNCIRLQRKGLQKWTWFGYRERLLKNYTEIQKQETFDYLHWVDSVQPVRIVYGPNRLWVLNFDSTQLELRIIDYYHFWFWDWTNSYASWLCELSTVSWRRLI